MNSFDGSNRYLAALTALILTLGLALLVGLGLTPRLHSDLSGAG
jgi:hypothetical protein